MILVDKDLHNPLTSKTIKKVLAVFQQGKSEQAVAATAAGGAVVNGTPVQYAGKIQALTVMTSVLPGAGESMTYDVKVNGVSILTAPYVLDLTKTAKVQIDLPLDTTKTAIAVGDILTVDRTYVAGAAAMTANAVVIAWS